MEEARTLEQTGKLEDIPQAIDLYEKAYLLDSSNLELLKSYSNSLIQAKEYDRAKEIALECVNLDMSDELCNANITNADMFSNNLELAQTSLDKCFENTPDNSLCLTNQASLYMQSYKYKKAIEEYKKVLNRRSKSKIRMDKSFILYQIAIAYDGFGDHKKYKEYVFEACELGEHYACKDFEKIAD